MESSTTDVTVIIPTFGDDPFWKQQASNAWYSAAHQSVRPRIARTHGPDLAGARNRGAEQAETEWLIFLDADDTLDLGYVEAMLNATGDVRRPSTLGVVDGVEDDAPVLIPRQSIFYANYIVIGAMIRREQFLSVGGFRDLPVLEDWDLFIRFHLDGADVVDVPEAIYRVNVRAGSRNSDEALHHAIYRDIRRTYQGQ